MNHSKWIRDYEWFSEQEVSASRKIRNESFYEICYNTLRRPTSKPENHSSNSDHSCVLPSPSSTSNAKEDLLVLQGTARGWSRGYFVLAARVVSLDLQLLDTFRSAVTPDKGKGQQNAEGDKKHAHSNTHLLNEVYKMYQKQNIKALLPIAINNFLALRYLIPTGT